MSTEKAATTVLEGLRQRAAGLVVDTLIAAHRRLSPQRLAPLAELFGRLAYHLDVQGREQALRNLRQTFRRAFTPADREALVRALYRHLGLLAFEYAALLARDDLRPYSRWVEMENLDPVHKALETHGNVIFAACHGGHFDLLGGRLAEEFPPLDVVMKPLDNPHLNERFVEVRHKLGMGVIAKRSALRSVVRRLRAGANLAITCDQRLRRRAVIARFFGRPAATLNTPAVLAIRFGIPVVPVFTWRSGGILEYRGYAEEPIWADPAAPRDEEVLRITQAINDAIERFVRAHPEQWDWRQLRWKLGQSVLSSARTHGAPERAA
ncbi:MAG: hypothetical protein O7A09_13160 [Proteobacteria bacterium]|nr:hypothetical protein [Pseudomonadota bacterium]MCZ6784401.1 hypothetical protein [Pseudomonadota bacterium]